MWGSLAAWILLVPSKLLRQDQLKTFPLFLFVIGDASLVYRVGNCDRTLCALELLRSCPLHLESPSVPVEEGHCVLEARLVPYLFIGHSPQCQGATLNI